MIKKQTFEIMSLIKQYFEHFEITQQKLILGMSFCKKLNTRRYAAI